MHLSFLKKKKKKVEWNCGNGIVEFHSTFYNSKSFFYPLFQQCHCHNCQKFIPSISAMQLSQTIFFSSHFQQWHCHNCQFFFFPIIWFSLRALTFRAPSRAVGMGKRNCDNTIAENQKFLSPTFYLSLSNFC